MGTHGHYKIIVLCSIWEIFVVHFHFPTGTSNILIIYTSDNRFLSILYMGILFMYKCDFGTLKILFILENTYTR